MPSYAASGTLLRKPFQDQREAERAFYEAPPLKTAFHNDESIPTEWIRHFILPSSDIQHQEEALSSLSAAKPSILDGAALNDGHGAEVNGAGSVVSDESLLARISKEDNEALAMLFRRYARMVRGVAYRVLRDSAEADDLLQDIFILIHRLCRTFDSSKGSARFWILQMTHRRAISRRRYLTSRHLYDRKEFDPAMGEPRDVLEDNATNGNLADEVLEKQQVLSAWFEQLSPNQQETLRLFFFEGCTFDEIAVKLGQTTVNARNHYYRGLDRLRKQIFSGKLPTFKHYDRKFQPY